MRHVITVVSNSEQLTEAPPRLKLRDDQTLHELTWYACANQQKPEQLLGDSNSRIGALLRAPVLAYKFYQLVHGIKLWSGKRPLILVRGCDLSSRVAAYAGSWGGGDVVKADLSDAQPFGPTRFVLAKDCSLKLNEG